MDQPLGIGRATPRRWRHDFVELSFKGGYAGKAVQTSSVKDRNTWSASEASQRTSSPNHPVRVKLCVNAGTVPNRAASRAIMLSRISDAGMNGPRTVTCAGTLSRATG